MNGIIFDIQHYAVYDGPGIRTSVFFKGCPLRCVWCHNPESQRPSVEISYFKERCKGCGKCLEACPTEAIRPSVGGIERDYASCKACGLCVDACENGAMEKIGREAGVGEITELVAMDKPFYDTSGGGVTVSGGEPTIQAEFLLELLRHLKSLGIHTAIETCGLFDEALVPDLVGVVDLFLFDIKHMDPEVHKEYTGVSNERILANFKLIHSAVGSERIIPRVPLIPGINTDRREVLALLDFLRTAGYSGEVHLMPYNRLAKTKYEKVGKGHLYRDMGELAEGIRDEVIREIEDYSFRVVVNK